MGVAGYSLACASPRLLYRPLRVAYLPHLVKGLPDRLPLRRVLVLFPVDKRPGLAVRKGEVPSVVSGADIVSAQRPTPAGEVLPEVFYPVVGFRGTNSRGSLFIRNPSHFSPPDRPRLFFYMSDLNETVQEALAAHLREVKMQVTAVPFSHPQDRPPAEEIQADYALGCAIEEFVLLSLFYYVQSRTSGDFSPVLGPTWARVNLTLTLYRWPSGEQLWEGRIGESLTDPVPGDDMHLYGTMGEVMSMALSRAVGSFLVTQAVQDVLSRR
jgi:hypothetical protein